MLQLLFVLFRKGIRILLVRLCPNSACPEGCLPLLLKGRVRTDVSPFLVAPGSLHVVLCQVVMRHVALWGNLVFKAKAGVHIGPILHIHNVLQLLPVAEWKAHTPLVPLRRKRLQIRLIQAC